MDALSQIVLGAAVTAAIAPARHRRGALLAGAALGTLPDLDVLPLMLVSDPVVEVVWHRSFSHSLLALPFVGWLIFALVRKRPAVAAAPKRWALAIQAALLTHPILDAFTVYGTQLWWPIPFRPAMWSSVFIIDPLYTVWLLAACVAAWVLRERPAAGRWLAGGLIASSMYLGWSLVAKSIVERNAERALVAQGLGDAPRFSVPTPFNTLLWRVVAMTPDGYVEGFWSIAADEGPMRFQHYPSAIDALDATRDFAAVRRLSWWNRGFMGAEVVGDRLVLRDLRMGTEPDYVFSFEVARREGDAWREIAPTKLPWPREAIAHLGELWNRIWHSPRT